MSPAAQRIAIAQACGDIAINGNWTTEEIIACGAIHEMRDYLNDLNAMHAATSTLTNYQHHGYRKLMLDSIIAKGEKNYPSEMRQWFDATAAQRAEAFLKTIGKWKEGA